MRSFAKRVFVGLLPGILAGGLFVSYGVYLWLRERYERGGPMSFRQARQLLVPARQWLHPVHETLEKFRLKPRDTVLELGPGPGYFTVEAARMVGDQGRVLCLDIQPEMIEMLHGRLRQHGVNNAQPIVGDATRLPLADNSVDNAFLAFVLGEVPDRPRAVAELLRVLKPGGVLSTMETLTDPDYMFEGHTRDLMAATGFRRLEHSRHRLGYIMSFGAPASEG